MEKYIIEKETLTEIADSIREHKNSEETIVVKNIAEEIANLPVIQQGITWDAFDEEGWVTEATFYTNGDEIPEELFRSTTDTGGHHGIYSRLQKVNFPSSITKIGKYGFIYCYLLPSFDFSNIEEIGFAAFSGCDNLELKEFPKSVKKIGSQAFSNTYKVSFSELPNGVMYDSGACNGMLGLTQIKLPSEWTEIPSSFFATCKNLVSVEFSPNITTIGTSCFQMCSNLALASLPSTLVTISERAFFQTPALKINKIPANVQTIGKWAFSYCNLMTTLTFEGTPASIDAAAFYNCNNLTTINVPWSEGEVANAPWGATKATINYNHTGN